MELQLGTNKYSAGGYVYYVQPNGTSTPNTECTSPLLLYTQTCVKVKVGTGSAVNVYNATVYRCESCNVNSASISVNSQTSSSPLTFAASNGTYFVYPNVSTGQNITAPACSETITSNWTNCLTVTLGGNSTTYNNVRYFFCPASNCPNSTNFYFNNQLSNYEFQQIQQFDMCTNYITTYTIYTGYTAGNQPPYSPCGNFGVAEYIWYACLQLEDNFGQTYRFSNVWLRTCSDFFNTCGGFNSTLSSSEVSEARNIIDTSSQNFNKKVDAIKKYAEKRGNYRLIKNYYDGTIAIIRKTKKNDTIKKGVDSIPGFSPFIYKQSIYIPIDSVRGEQLNNVEMATLLPAGGTEFQPFVVLPNCPPEFEGGVANVELSPCIGGTGNDHIGWSVVLDNPATEDIPYMIDVVLADQFGTQFIYSIYGTVLNGNISDVVLPCQGGAYISNADQVISWCISISIPEPPGAGCPPEYAHKTSRFPSVDISGNVNIDEIMARKLEEVKGTIASACEGSVEQLLLKLRPFLIANIPSTEANLTTHATYLRIKSRLIDICKAGGDLDHPFGASTTRPGMTANGFTTFQEVLAAEFPLTLEYNPWLIGGPLPWGKKQQVVATTSNRTNESICNKLAAAQSAATAAGKTVFQYLVDTYGAGTVTITSEELTQLQQGCTNCRFLLDEPVTLPVFLDTQNEGCISRSAFNDANSTFSSLLGTDVNNANYADVYRNFMNSRFGLVLAESDYNTFETSSDGYLCNQVFPDPIPADPFACANEMMGTAIINAKRAYEDYLVLIKRQFQQEYVTNCMNIQPLANLEKSESYNAITLYLYDNAGNLVETVAPREFRRIGETVFPTVDAVRNGLAGNRSLAPHIQTTRYYFNSLNQVIGQYTPDADSSSFWYDTKGRLFASQNKEQRTPTDIDGTTLPSNRYSYTKYDGLGRIIEVGEQSGTNMASILNNSFVQEVGITDFFTGGIKKSITKTYYDEESSISSHPGFIELQGKLDHLRKRVVSSTYQEDEISPIEQATYYSYDLMGNVKSIWQQVSGLSELKKTDYQFDLASGKTTAVLYQDGKSDAFYHQYEYDGENRIKSVYTNTQKAVSAGLLSIINTPGTKKDASYQYYLHGPLSRTELGGNLQGMDYSYTIHGWLKAMNGQDLNPLREMGRDGESGSGIHAGFSRDVLAYSLGYYIDDYAPINGSTYIRSYSYFGVAALRGISLFNGLINYSTVANKGLGDGPTIMAGIYSYHQLYTLAHRDTRIIPAGTTSWSDKVGASYKYCERFGKDINGNLLTIIRSGDQNVDQYKMDDLRLIYDGNRLVQVKELHTNSGLYSNDIEHQEINNYSYDKIGNLISDVQEGITGIFWNVYGKIREIRKGATVIKYRYDAAGNRVYKEEVGPGVNNATWYVRDAQGNTLATYEGVATPTIKESYIYGSSRLGSYSWNIGVGTPARTYEISNYLGNVMATIGDGQIPRMNGSLIEYYDADIKTATDYYSYGMVMPGRSFNSGTYRYGFNGQEMSNEIKGVGNSYTAEFWEYDPRLGKRWNLDPVVNPSISSYATFNNNPIIMVDPNGDTPYDIIYRDKNNKELGRIKTDEKYDQYITVLKGSVTVEGNAATFSEDYQDRLANVVWHNRSDNIRDQSQANLNEDRPLKPASVGGPDIVSKPVQKTFDVAGAIATSTQAGSSGVLRGARLARLAGGVGTVPIGIPSSLSGKSFNVVTLGRINASTAIKITRAAEIVDAVSKPVAVIGGAVGILKDGKLSAGDVGVAALTYAQLAFPVFGLAVGIYDLGSLVFDYKSSADLLHDAIDRNIPVPSVYFRSRK
jgi:RHS repeat-associated protein